MDAGPRVARAMLPTPAQLAALRCALCVYPGGVEDALAGWRSAARAEAGAAVDAVGAREWIAFLDTKGRCRARLYLLPDSDFLAWETLTNRLPQCAEAPCEPLPALCRRLDARMRAGRWRAVVLGLRASWCGSAWTLQAVPTPLSPLGLRVARAIVRCEAAEPMLTLPRDVPIGDASRRRHVAAGARVADEFFSRISRRGLP